MPSDRQLNPQATCHLPRGEARWTALSLKKAVQQCQLDLPTITRAAALAARVHQHQRRSADGSPYVTHPLQVAALVCHWGGRTEDVIIGILHDTAEDNPGGPREMLDLIAGRFSPATSRRVAALSKDTSIADPQARAQDMMNRLDAALHDAGPGLAAIRVADRLHNVVTSGHLSAAKLFKLQDSTQAFMVPLARRLGLNAVADFLASGPRAWAQVPPSQFVGRMLQLQQPWLGDAQL